jgi:KDO2-lipid IV(A) lauroyltransferase
MPLLYLLSDFLYFVVYQIIGYRKVVVRHNLLACFPEKNTNELRQIERKYYHHMCDLLVESLKQCTANHEFLANRVSLTGVEEVNKVLDSGKSVMFVMGHVNSWEWVMQSMKKRFDGPLYCLYKKITNKQVDEVVLRNRTRHGLILIEMSGVIRFLLENRAKAVAGCFIADQNPPRKSAIWSTFFNRDTAFFSGFQKLAKRFDQQVFFIDVRKESRGRYAANLEIMVENPASLSEQELTDIFASRLEKQIKEQPAYWLWSHRRWKYQKDPSNT